MVKSATLGDFTRSEQQRTVKAVMNCSFKADNSSVNWSAHSSICLFFVYNKQEVR